VLLLGRSWAEAEIPHGGLGDGLQAKGRWGLESPQYKAHEHRADDEMDLEVIPKHGGFMG
jgi:hypothetical protein